VTIRWGDDVVFQGEVVRTMATLVPTMAAADDPHLAFPAEVVVDRREPAP